MKFKQSITSVWQAICSVPWVRGMLLALMSVVLGVTLFSTGRTVLKIMRLNSTIAEKEKERDQYIRSIEEDSIMIERLRYDEYLEKYAREAFNMQRADEQVYIIEDKH